MPYADYAYYSGTYLGSSIAEADFPRLALRASAHIDRITFGRAATQTDAETVDKIKMATCAVAEELQTQDQSGGADALTSESQGGYSVTYAANSTRAMTNTQRIQTASALWLESTYLMFSGFNNGEYGGDCSDEDE